MKKKEKEKEKISMKDQKEVKENVFEDQKKKEIYYQNNSKKVQIKVIVIYIKI